jgi:peptide/nickel transport system permease protein
LAEPSTQRRVTRFRTTIDPQTPTLGNMLRDGQPHIQRSAGLALYPGVALFLTVLTLNLLGDGLRDALDPRARRR